jgi:hypothetical protein
MEDDVFLQHIIMPESRAARVENMEPAKLEVAKKFLAEIAKIRPIAKAPRAPGRCAFAMDFLPARQRLRAGPKK